MESKGLHVNMPETKIMISRTQDYHKKIYWASILGRCAITMLARTPFSATNVRAGYTTGIVASKVH